MYTKIRWPAQVFGGSSVFKLLVLCSFTLVLFATMSSQVLAIRGNSGPQSGPRLAAYNALMRFRRQNVDLNELDETHINAYIALRDGAGRVDAKRILAYLKTKREQYEHGSSLAFTYWAVPKGNFPNGLPADVQECVKSGDDLAEAAVIGGGEVDYDNYFIIDQQIDRTRLGQDVRTLQIYQGIRTDSVSERPQATNGALPLGQPHAAVPSPLLAIEGMPSEPQAPPHALASHVRRRN